MDVFTLTTAVPSPNDPSFIKIQSERFSCSVLFRHEHSSELSLNFLNSAAEHLHTYPNPSASIFLAYSR